MFYTRQKEKSKFFEALTLKNISIGLFVSVVIGFIAIHASRFWGPSSSGLDHFANPDIPVFYETTISIFDDSFNTDIRKPPALASIASDFENKNYEFFIYEKPLLHGLNNTTAFWISRLNLGPVLEEDSEQLKDSHNDQLDREENLNTYFKSPKFTADGKYVVYCKKYHSSSSPALFLMRIDGNGTTTTFKRITNVSDCSSYNLTPDGKGVVYTRTAFGTEGDSIFKIDLNGENETLLVAYAPETIYTNPIIVDFEKNVENEIEDDYSQIIRVVEQRVYFQIATGLRYLVLNTTPPSSEEDFIVFDYGNFQQSDLKLCPQALNSLDNDGKFLLTLNNSSEIFICTPELNCQQLVAPVPSSKVTDAILDRNGTTVYYIQEDNYSSRCLIKRKIDGNDTDTYPQVLISDLLTSSFSHFSHIPNQADEFDDDE